MLLFRISVQFLFSHCCMNLRLGLHVSILHRILSSKMEILYKLLCRKRFHTTYHWLDSISKATKRLFHVFLYERGAGTPYEKDLLSVEQVNLVGARWECVNMIIKSRMQNQFILFTS